MTVMSRVELAKIGAKVRLDELNKERDTLLDFIGYPEELKSQIAKKVVKKKKLHWTQTPAGKRKMSKLMKAKYQNGWRGKG